jgi:signal transduction histidine kinase
VARGLGLAWVGVLAFLIARPHGPFALPVQIVCFAVLGLGLIAWALTEVRPAAARLLPPILGVMSVAAGIGCAAGGGGTAMVAFGLVTAMVAGSELGLSEALAVTGAGILAIEITGLTFGGSYGVLLGLPVLVLSGLVVGRNRGAYRIQAEQAAALLAQREQLEAEQRRADLLVERARIAREIHDVLAHSLGALGIQIQAARAVLTDHGDAGRADEILAAAQRMAAEGLVETRRAVHALRTGTLPLDQELARVSDTYARRYHVVASFGTSGTPRPLPPDATVALLRVAQESLVNAAKHAAGQRVAVRLDYSGADVRLTVRNDLAPGTGPARPATPATAADPDGPPNPDGPSKPDGPPNPDGPAGPGSPGVDTINGGYGLTGMRERLRLLNGTLQAGPRDGEWVVTAELPQPPAETVAS